MSVKNNLKINIHRHSEGNVMTEESTAMYSNVMDPSVGVASLKDDNRMGQRGRSMVEMLGVLAIVGVLSVGGVYGYGVAMKKHKANELLHRASMLASTVSAQIMSGKDPTTLDTFADSNLGKFALDYDPTKTTFDLKISEMDSAVCTQLEKMAGGMVRDVECDGTTATLTYYKNLATTEAEGESFNSGCKSEIINVYNCETKTTTPCCPDNGNSCTQPVCSCDEENLCPGNQVCENGVCGCPSTDKWVDGEIVKDDDWRPLPPYKGRLGNDGQTCCYDAFSYSKTDGYYKDLNINVCGCPTGLTADLNVIDDVTYPSIYKTKNGICCTSYGNAFYAPDMIYSEINIDECGCPTYAAETLDADPENVRQVSDGTCCNEWNNALYMNDVQVPTYGEFKPQSCGCPIQGIVEWGPFYDRGDFNTYMNNGVCCSNYGYAVRDDSTESYYQIFYDQLDIANCGCPKASLVDGQDFTNVELRDGVCCSNGKAYEASLDQDGYPTGGYTKTDSRCE